MGTQTHARYTDDEAITAAKTDADLLNFTQGARVYNDVALTIPNNNWTALTFNSERYDTNDIHDISTNNSRLTCKTAGKYIINASFFFEDHATGIRSSRIRLGGSTVIQVCYLGKREDDFWAGSLTTIYDLAVDEWVEVLAYQNSGGDLTILAIGNYTPEFMMQRIG